MIIVLYDNIFLIGSYIRIKIHGVHASLIA